MPIIAPKINFLPQQAILPSELTELVMHILRLITATPDQLSYKTVEQYLKQLPRQHREVINYLDPARPLVPAEKYYHSEMIATVRFAHYHLYTLLSSYIEDITKISAICVKEIQPIVKFTRLHHYELTLTFQLWLNQTAYTFRPIIQMNLDYRCSAFCREKIQIQTEKGMALLEPIKYRQRSQGPRLRLNSH